MKQLINQIHSEGFLFCQTKDEKAALLLDLFKFDQIDFSVLKHAPVLMLFNDEALVERTFDYIPESYFQLSELSEKPVDALLSFNGKNDSQENRIELQCRILEQSGTLQQLLNRVRKPLLLLNESQIEKLNPQFKLPSRPENENLIIESIDASKSTLIKFDNGGSFKIVRK